jgi:predicted DNA-binding transcriptional regulator AlpA
MTLAELEGRATVTLEQALPFYGVGRTTGYGLAKQGRLPGCRRLGGRWVVVVPALLAWLGAHPTDDGAPAEDCTGAPSSSSPSPTPGTTPATTLEEDREPSS